MSTRRWRGVAFVGETALVGAAVLAFVVGSMLVGPMLLGGDAANAAPIPQSPAGGEVPATVGATPGPTNIESVTTTETKLRRVVIGLLAVSAVTAVLTLGYARHTSPRRRAAEAAARDEARARRMATAAALGNFGSAPPRESVTERIAPPVTARVEAADRPRRRRPDPRPQPRRPG